MISEMKKLALATALVALPHSCPVLAQERSGPALWKVADEDTTIYLFGTIHILPRDIEWFGGEIEEAFTTSQQFVTEVDMDEAANIQPQDILPRASLPEGQTLRALMNEVDRSEYESGLQQLGLPAQAFDRFEPWFATMNLNTMLPLRAGYEVNSGADIVLTGMATGKQMSTLETLDFQMDRFDGIELDKQLDMLDRTIGWLPQSKEYLDRLVFYWLQGDADAIAVIVNWNFNDPTIYDRLVSDRNANWAEWIDERLDQPGTVFMAVGAGHLAGLGSVQEHLAERGISTTRLR